ncbi:YceI family protein [Rheinheimera sp. YQF-2]|uniref:YceI family protein n=1 Tax=Rheinheimera lutimaris TaxID=2740584 RepID=A0A7Y5AR39_9GAMM|nr:YceI family protein [Rheinheimera lutimaris]NRQ43002.1 YceI family protein [Rheinheimera lutimaris]
MKLFALALALSSTVATAANWTLDNSQSALNFVSVKNELIAETHSFNQLSGNWDGSNVTVDIAVNSMDTLIPIRNERIWQYVLHAEKYAAITVSAPLQQETLAKLATGDSVVADVPLAVTIASETVTLTAKLRITKLNANTLQAVTEAPLMLNTNSFKLTAGVAKLQELAGLSSIEPLVPVSFNVRFKQQ